MTYRVFEAFLILLLRLCKFNCSERLEINDVHNVNQLNKNFNHLYKGICEYCRIFNLD